METRIRERLRDLAEEAPTGRTLPATVRRRARRRIGVTLAVGVVVVAAAALGVSQGLRLISERPARPARQQDARVFAPGRIAVGGFERIVAVDPADPTATEDLSLVTNVGQSPVDWSEDGSMLLIARSPFGGVEAPAVELLVHYADGSEEVLVEGQGILGGSFSPDGTQVVFARAGEGPEGEPVDSLFVVPVGGGTPRRIEDGGEYPAWSHPVWSPDGERIYYFGVFRDGADDAPGLAWTNADGSGDGFLVGDLLLPEVEGGTAGLAWSPDGARLAFAGISEAGHRAVYVVNADGTGLTELIGSDDERYGWPTWSPDGSRIAFVAGKRLMTMNADGTDVRELATARELGTAPVRGRIAWNPVAA